MKRCLFVGALLVTTLTGFPNTARADWWDVVEALSGPGPFRHRPLLGSHWAFTGFCFDTPKPDAKGIEPTVKYSVLGRADQIPDTMPCMYADFANYHVNHEDNTHGGGKFGDVDLQTFEVGVSFQLHRPFEYGVALGVARFESGGRVTKKPIFTPIRFVAKPLYFIPDKWIPGFRKHDWPGFLKIEVREMVVGGPLTGDMFGATAGDFKVDHDFLTSWGAIVFDIGPPLADLFRKAKREAY